MSPEREDNKDTVKNCILSPSLFQDPLRNVRAGEGTWWALGQESN